MSTVSNHLFFMGAFLFFSHAKKKRRRHLVRPGYIPKSARTLQDATDYELSLNEDATSLRQSAEWGMRGFQGSFPRLTEDIVYEKDGERYLFLSTAVLLYNFRARYVGYNQIRSVFLSEQERGTLDELFTVLPN